MQIEPKLLTFQSRASSDILPLITTGSCLLIGATGTGKTYILSDVIKKLEKEDLILRSTKPFPILYLTASPVVEQTQQVALGEFGIKRLIVMNYDKLRSTLGVMFIEWIKVNPDLKQYTERELWEMSHLAELSDEAIAYVVNERQALMDLENPYWRPEYMPNIIICDESQKLKNEKTQQTEIINQYIKQGGRLLLSSATPFARVSEGKITSLALRPKFTSPELGVSVDLNERLWPAFAKEISGSRSAPTDFNFEAVGRLRDALEHRIVRLKGVKFDKKCHSHCKLIDFQNDEDRKRYNEAYIEYLKKLQSINREAPGGIAAIWVASQKFRQMSELIRAPYLAGHANFLVQDCSKQVCVASNFVDTLNATERELISLGVTEDKISIIVGGQSSKERQFNIQRFQTGKTDYCLFTLKSGGVGLSLHHHERNKDICKPRYIVLPPTWSAIEIVQAFGRPHRINSISDTYADIVWFRGTEEENVAAKLEPKLDCLQELVQKRETWMGVFSRRAELNEVKELSRLIEQESVDVDLDGDVEIFDGEALSN